MPTILLRFALLFAVALATVPAHAQQQKTLRYAFEIAETGFDPAQISDLYSRTVASNVFDAPLRFAYLAPSGTVEPNTAAALPDVSADFKTFTFHIKPGIYFDDDPAFHGKKRELTAADYVYSYKRIFDPHWKSPSYGQFEVAEFVGMSALRDEALKTGKFDYDREVEGLRTLDRYTFRVVLGKPDPRFSSLFADASILGAVAREVVEAYGDKIMEHPVGTGPYRLAQWRRSSLLVMERNPNYRDDVFSVQPDPSNADAVALATKLKGRKLPLIDRIEISIIEESQPRWLAFLNGEQDFLERMPYDLTPLAIPNNKPSPTLIKKGVRVERAPIIDVSFSVYNMENPVIGGYTPEKIALRRALNLAFDSEEMIRAVYKGQAFLAQSMIMPGTYGYDPDVRTEMGETDVARARALLDTYGYVDRDGDGWREMPDGSPLVIEMATTPDQRSRINDEIWKRSMDRIGVRINFNVAKWPEQLRRAQNGQFMAWQLGLQAAGPDGADSLRYAYGPAKGAEDLCRFELPEYDKLYRQQASMPNGPERLAVQRKMTEILVAYAPMQFIAHRYEVNLTYPWVVGRRRWPFVRDWWRYVDIDDSKRPSH